ncbi:MAG: T9SS type A sorting domain-containing protein [Bacteroidales bacterium]|nr:T9SS type A sorting domain-containing protein [Bacteroidales bacterium]
MKQFFLSFGGGLLLVLLSATTTAQVPMLPQEVIMGPGYANEVYYQFTSFNTYETPRTAWDLSFRTEPGSAAVLINDGNNAVLWVYPYADTSGWSTVDTNDLYEYPPLYNDPDVWENGAFNRQSAGYPDYGWGIYDEGTQIITGDSIFIILLADGSWKKVWIVEKNTVENTWLIRYANLDGSDFQEITIDADNHVTKDMVGFNMQTNLPVDYQPVKESWDILFTKYMAWHPTGAPVIVTGVLSNPAIQAKKFYPVDPEFNDWWDAPWDNGRSTIGWDWKYFDLNTFTYTILDSMVFYVWEQSGNVYRLKFTGFEGTTSGVIDFGIAIVMGVGMDDTGQPAAELRLWPNPASDRLNVEVQSRSQVSDALTMVILDMTGRILRTELLAPGEDQATWDISSLASGTYFLTIQAENERSTWKFVKW